MSIAAQLSPETSRRVAERRVETLQQLLDDKQQALDLVARELAASKDNVQRLQHQVTSLRRSVHGSLQHSADCPKAAAADRATLLASVTNAASTVASAAPTPLRNDRPGSSATPSRPLDLSPARLSSQNGAADRPASAADLPRVMLKAEEAMGSHCAAAVGVTPISDGSAEAEAAKSLAHQRALLYLTQCYAVAEQPCQVALRALFHSHPEGQPPPPRIRRPSTPATQISAVAGATPKPSVHFEGDAPPPADATAPPTPHPEAADTHMATEQGEWDFAATLPVDTTYPQLAALADVLLMLPPRRVSLLDVVCDTTTAQCVVNLVRQLPAIDVLRLRCVDDGAASAVAGLLVAAPSIGRIELPGLAVSDNTADGGGLPALLLAMDKTSLGDVTLDLAASTVSSVASLEANVRPSPRWVEAIFDRTPVTESFLDAFTAQCPNLSSLSVQHQGATLREAFTQMLNAPHGAKLKTLRVTGCTGLTSLHFNFVETLATDLKGVTSVKLPSTTTLLGPLRQFPCIAWQCPRLTKVHFHSVPLCERELMALSGGSPLLEVVVLEQCRLQGLGLFLSKLRRVIEVSVARSHGVHDADLTQLPRHLLALDISGCPLLTDRALFDLKGRMPGLAALAADGCPLTDAGVVELKEHGALGRLSLKGCVNVSRRMVETLREAIASVVY